MFKLKAHKSLIKYAVPVRRTTTRNVPITSTQVRMYKFPHLKLTSSGIDEVGELHFSQLTIKLRFWTERFFSLGTPAIHSRFESAFRYQLKKYGIDVEYIFDFSVFDLAISFASHPIKIDTAIPRKGVHQKKEWNQTYRFEIQSIDTAIARQEALPVHGTNEAPTALTFLPTKVGKPVDLQWLVEVDKPIDLQSPKMAVQPTPFEMFGAIKSESVAAPFSILQITRIQKADHLSLNCHTSAEPFPTLQTPTVHHIDISSLSNDSPAEKAQQKQILATSSTSASQSPDQPANQISPPSE